MQAEKMEVYSLEKNDVQSVSLFLVPLTDQGQNQYLREASEVMRARKQRSRI